MLARVTMKYFELINYDVLTNQSFLALLNKYILMDEAQRRII